MSEVTTFSTDLGNLSEQGQRSGAVPVDEATPVVVIEDQEAKPEGEAPETGKEPGEDTTPAWMKREVTIQRNKRRAVEAELAATREENANLAKALAERTKAETPAERPKRPRPDDFFHPEDFDAAMDEYDDALSLYNVNKAKAELVAESNARRQEQAQTARASEMTTAWQTQLTAAKAKHPDVEDVLSDPDFAQAVEALKPANAEAIAEAITTDDNGVMVMYHLATNPEDASRIFALSSAAAQVREIGKLAAKITAPPPVSKAPAPIRRVAGVAPAANKSPEEESYNEYAARRASEMKARNERAF